MALFLTRGKTPGLRPGNGSPMNLQDLSLFLYGFPSRENIWKKLKLQKSNISSTMQKLIKTPLLYGNQTSKNHISSRPWKCCYDDLIDI